MVSRCFAEPFQTPTSSLLRNSPHHYPEPEPSWHLFYPTPGDRSAECNFFITAIFRKANPLPITV
jgi:hypothetical protein